MAIEVAWRDAASGRPRTRPMGELRQRIMQVGAGRKIAYVVDAEFTPANTAAIVTLARGADILFIEATILHSDAQRSAARTPTRSESIQPESMWMSASTRAASSSPKLFSACSIVHSWK